MTWPTPPPAVPWPEEYQAGPEPEGDVRTLTLATAAGITMRRATFLWHQRIPDSAVTLLAGREGMSKTLLSCWLAARITRGQLEGSRRHRPGDVVYVGTEDDRATVLVPRLAAAGADLTRVHFVDVAGAGFSVTLDTAPLAHRLRSLEAPALLIIDPVDAHLGGGVDSHKKAEVQAALAHLARMAQEHGCAVLALAHLNKGESRDVLTKVVGSVGFTTSVRSVLAVGEHPDEPRDRVVLLRKANMTDASAVPALRYRTEGVELDAPDGGDPIITGAVVIVGEEVGLDPNAILNVPDAEERTARTEAAEWLRDLLADGPMPAKEVKRMATDADIAARTLQRARAELAVVIQRDEHARGRPSTWALPSFVPTDSGHSLCGTDGTKTETPSDMPFPARDSVTCHGPDTGTGTEQEGMAALVAAFPTAIAGGGS